MRKRWAAFQQGWMDFRQALAKIKKEAKAQLPLWREDAHQASEELRGKVEGTRSRLRATWADWKTIFSTVDFSREKMHQMLFEDRTQLGRLFESLLMGAIVLSVLVVMLDSVPAIHRRFGWLMVTLEWGFTILFTFEYLLRLYSAHHPFRYATSFFGVIDLVTVLPTYISFFVPGAHTFLVLRILRVFRIFRLFKLFKLLRAGNTILTALRASKEKIAVFLIFVLMLVAIMGSMLYIVEASVENSGFTSIPISIYWAIVTLTTVGYGDISPTTWFGQFIAALVMLMGYVIIAVPTGIVSAELAVGRKAPEVLQLECPRCGKEEHEKESRFCSRCAERLV